MQVEQHWPSRRNGGEVRRTETMGSSVLNDEVPPLCWVISSSSVEYSSSSSVPHCGRSWGCARGACRRGTAGARAPRAQSSIACCACPCLRQPRGPPGTSSTAAAAARRRSRDEFSSPTSSMARSCRSAASSAHIWGSDSEEKCRRFSHKSCKEGNKSWKKKEQPLKFSATTENK